VRRDRALAFVVAALVGSVAGDAGARCAPEPLVPPGPFPLPLALVAAVGEAPAITGSASIGAPTKGSLWAGVELTESDDIERAGGYPWGTANVVRAIQRAAREVRRCHPESPRVIVGDISRERGGWLRPHRSHQSGLDADIGYFHVGPATWYQRVRPATFDAPRTWTLLRALIEGGDVDTIFVDASVQRLLKEHIAKLAPDEQAGPDVFPTPRKRDSIIRHTWGHLTHFHVRFRDAEAVALGERIEAVRPKPPKHRVARR
jgi:murein endopeptidase